MKRGDRVAILLPQRPETAIAYIAMFQMGAIALPLSHLFGPDALEYRMEHAEASVAIVEPATIANLWAIKDRLTHLRHVIGVGGATRAGVHDWEDLLEKAVFAFHAGRHRGRRPGADHLHQRHHRPAQGRAQGAPRDDRQRAGVRALARLLPAAGRHVLVAGRLGVDRRADGRAAAGVAFGVPILGYRGRFDAEKAYYLLEKYGVRNSFLFPTALKLMMKAVPEPKAKYDFNLRSIMSAGESVGVTVFEWAREQLGVTINEMFGQTEINYVVGNCQAAWPAKPGSIGRPYPGHRVAVIDDKGNRAATRASWARSPSTALQGQPDPVFFLEYWKNPQATKDKFIGDWGCTGDQAKMDEDGYLWYQGRSDDVIKSAGYRIGPAEIESCLVKHPAVLNAAVIGKPDATRGSIVKAFVVLQPGHSASESLVERDPEPRARPPRALRVSARDRVHRRAADDHHRQGAAQGTAQARRS